MNNAIIAFLGGMASGGFIWRIATSWREKKRRENIIKSTTVDVFKIEDAWKIFQEALEKSHSKLRRKQFSKQSQFYQHKVWKRNR